MSLSSQHTEIQQLIKAFEDEAAKFHPLQLSTYFIANGGQVDKRKFKTPNHAISLWQYYGLLGSEDVQNRLIDNLREGNCKWGW